MINDSDVINSQLVYTKTTSDRGKIYTSLVSDSLSVKLCSDYDSRIHVNDSRIHVNFILSFFFEIDSDCVINCAALLL